MYPSLNRYPCTSSKYFSSSGRRRELGARIVCRSFSSSLKSRNCWNRWHGTSWRRPDSAGNREEVDPYVGQYSARRQLKPYRRRMPNGQRPAFRHHYVPRSYLRHFVDAHDQLYGYRLPTRQAFPTTPKKAAYEEHFYTDLHEQAASALEGELAKFEGPFASVHRAILAAVERSNRLQPPTITSAKKLHLAQFAALQLIRTKKTREQMDAYAATIRTPGVTLTNEELARGSHINMIRSHLQSDLRVFAQAIVRHRLIFLTAPQGEVFWTSDHPVTIARGLDSGRISLGGGVGNDELELYLPLSSRVIAVFVGTHIGSLDPVYLLKPHQVAERNRVTHANAHETLYAARPIALSET
jgi:Protein of unknown function (DUF4238)